MTTISEFRQNVQKVFEEGLKVQFVPGRLEGPNQFGEWLGSCYLERVQEDPARVDEQQIFITLRLFAPYVQQRSPNEPYDPTPLEEMAEKILATIAANQTNLGAWYQRVRSIDFDPVSQGVQAQVFAFSGNPGTGTP